MVCGGLRWFSRFLTAHGHTDVLSSQILVVGCGGLRWFVVDCGGLSFSHTLIHRSPATENSAPDFSTI